MTAATAERAPMSLASRVDADSALRSVMAGLPIPVLLLIGILIGSTPLTMIAIVCSLAASLVVPELGLMTLALVAPLLSRPLLPAPGYPLILAVAILLGCLYRLPVERPQVRMSRSLVVGLAFILFVFVRQIQSLVAGYATVDDHLVGSLMTKLLTGIVVAIDAALLLRRRNVYPIVIVLLISAVTTAVVALTTSNADPQGILKNLVAPFTDAPSRPSGSFGGPNEFGLFIAAALFLGVGWLLTSARSPNDPGAAGWGAGGARRGTRRVDVTWSARRRPRGRHRLELRAQPARRGSRRRERARPRHRGLPAPG